MISETGVVVYRGTLESYASCMSSFVRNFIECLEDKELCKIIPDFRLIRDQVWVIGATTSKAKHKEALRTRS